MFELFLAIAYAPFFGIVSAMTAVVGILWETPRPEVRSKQRLVLALVTVGALLVIGGVVSYYVGNDSAVGFPIFVGYFCFVFGGIIGRESEKDCARRPAESVAGRPVADEPPKKRRRCVPKTESR